MFTGIVQRLGTVREMTRVPFGARLLVEAAGWAAPLAPGDSVAVAGCCLTLVDEPETAEAIAAGSLPFDVIRQTLSATTLGALTPGAHVNLEPSVTPTTMLGGHVVQGHVDDVAVVRRVDRSDAEWRVAIEPPAALLDTIIERGSVAVDGVSLTVASLDGPRFEVALIPTTLTRTTLGELAEGSRVNLETDYVAKTVVAWLKRSRLATSAE